MMDNIGVIFSVVMLVPLLTIMIFLSHCIAFEILTDIDILTNYIQPFFQELLIQGSQK